MPLHPVITTYLEQAELELKKLRGVHLADVLANLRDTLAADVACHDGPARTEGQWLDHFHEQYGTPEQFAATAREAVAAEQPSQPKGYSPGWRVACARCGRSSPLALAAAGYRVGARSAGPKYGLIRCKTCAGFRWGRHTRDMDKPTVTAALGEHRTSQDLLDDNRPWLTVAAITGSIAAVLAIAGVVAVII